MADGDLSIAFEGVVSGGVGNVEPVATGLSLSWPRHRYDEGDHWPVAISVANDDGDLVDASVSVEFIAPSGEHHSVTPSHSGTGRFSATQQLDEPGEWYVVVVSSGAYSATEIGRVPAIPLPLGA